MSKGGACHLPVPLEAGCNGWHSREGVQGFGQIDGLGKEGWIPCGAATIWFDTAAAGHENEVPLQAACLGALQGAARAERVQLYAVEGSQGMLPSRFFQGGKVTVVVLHLQVSLLVATAEPLHPCMPEQGGAASWWQAH